MKRKPTKLAVPGWITGSFADPNELKVFLAMRRRAKLRGTKGKR